MPLLVTPTLERTVKKLRTQQKHARNLAVKTIADDPEKGESKTGDLAGVRVYKFRLANQLCRLACRLPDDETTKLLMVGPHENFYQDLKRQGEE